MIGPSPALEPARGPSRQAVVLAMAETGWLIDGDPELAWRFSDTGPDGQPSAEPAEAVADGSVKP